MSAGPFPFLLHFAKLSGFALVVIGAFLGGVLWSQYSQPFGSERIEDAIPSSAKRSSVSALPEPEDFYPVAEFREQSAILLGAYQQFPSNPRLYVDIAKAIGGRVPLFGLVQDESAAVAARETARRLGIPEGSLHFLPLPADTIWVRDYAPFLVRREDNSVFMIDAKYQSRVSREVRKRDEEMANALADLLDLPIRSIPLILEGGNFMSNGDGSIISTGRMVQLNSEFRFGEELLGDLIADYFGVRRWSYVAPLEGEPTGHVDMFATLLGKNILVVGKIDPAVDPVNAERLDRAAAHFSEIVTSLGPMQVYRIPMPPRWGNSWRSYTNIILANGILLMPSFSDVDPAIEDAAEEVYRALLPSWEVKRINCDALVKEEGQLHCMSYNLPKYVSIEGLLRKAGVKPVASGNPGDPALNGRRKSS